MDSRREPSDKLMALSFINSVDRPQSRRDHEEIAIPWRKAFPEVTDDLLPGFTLKGTRQLAGLTQQQLANQVGVSRSQISALENGKQSIQQELAKKLAKVFKVNYRLFLA